MSDFQRDLILRFFLVFVIIALAFGAVAVKIILLQTKEREQLLQLEQKQSKANHEIPAKRGNIFDCEGRLLAGSIPTYLIFIDTQAESLRKNNGEAFFSNLDTLSYQLADIFPEKTPAEYRKYLQEGYKKGNRRLRINDKRATYTQYKRVMKLPYFAQGRQKSGAYTEEGHRRIKPFGPLCLRTIGGTYSDSGLGNSGIEKSYDEILRGKPGEGIKQRVGNFTTEIPIVNAVDGSDVVTTINTDLQDIVDNELRYTLSQTKGDWACCILMETHSGEIKAICNLDRNADGTYTEQTNHAVTKMEPGSMFKTISLIAALDDGKVQLTDTFHVNPKGWIYHDRKHPINDSHYIPELHGVLTAKQGLTASSNIVLAKIVTRAYDKKAEKYVNKLNSMGMSKTFESDIPGTQSPKIDIPKDRETLARMAFGYSVEIPPIYTLMYYNAIANNGRMITPFLVKEIRKNDDTVKRMSAHTLNSSICGKSALNDIRTCLETVVWDTLGTASKRKWSNKAQSKIVHIAGKTGTARVLENGKYLTNFHRIAFCGYFPMEEPKYTCICVIHKVNSRDAGTDCGGTVRRIAERVMAHHTIEQEKVAKEDINKPHIKKGLHSQALTVSRELDLGLSRNKQKWGSYNESYELQTMEVSKNIVPDVRGMGAKDAVYAIEQTGMIANISGAGRVVTQSITAGSKPLKGGTVYLELR